MKNFNLVITVLLVSLLSACASKKPVEPVEETPVAAAKPAPGSTAAAAPVAPVAVDPLNDPNSLLAKRSMYYPFDGYVVQDADKPAVQAHAQYLAEHPDRKIRVEGHADERGSNEYNLALGQRRADGVKSMLVLGGAKSSQIETASYGEEKPVASGHDEAAWSQNRRADLIY